MWNQLQIHPPCFDCFSTAYERSFICRMLKSQCFKRRLPDGVPDQPENRSTAVLVRGRVHELSPANPQTVLVAICFPLIEPSLRSIEPDSYDTLCFTTLHEMDLRIKATSDNIVFFLGFSENQLLHCSWYQFVHHNDLQEATHLHCRVRSGCGQCTAVLRLLTRDGSTIYVRTVAGLVKQDDLDTYTPVIQFNNRVLR
ncbi:Neuronal PAS domain-containing protein 4 [Holothuria leucospilota]|uniref:Neuronal PAS domain-containing protein 4 n=1 Tax=Holothuria leucospilota TaxID=206669 RepID=A0A9Q1HD77_HOLLE|nr:Neuronal PAS domain-containing protein 4 [Holothuria leucospilota]